ncbi:K(+)/H(+) antiporter [Xylographa soralifera]|nr:K(+)/H(+) antiporter [Xylographa soralifera]
MASSALPTVTRVLTQVVTQTVASATPSSTQRATPQGGILEGSNPSIYDPKNPIFIFVIQAGIILIFCRLLHYPLSKLRQPRVIAEVIVGVILGPSAMGHIPGFTNAIFPAASIPNLTLVANVGLILFLFLVGLEVDLRFLVSNWRVAITVGALGMALPFGMGCAIAYGLYNQFRDDPGTVPISFGVYMLFVAVAMAITAFPVLCRILTELKLLQTPVGVIVLSAGVSNDIVGWILLALCVALVNAGSGLTALWVLLVCVGYILFLAFVVRPGFMWILQRSGSLQNGPTQSVVALTLIMVLASAFFTGVIGVHPIFGGFVIGLICPHEGGFAIKITEKVEDLVAVLFLPLYFALSGLSTNLGLLNNGITWAYVVGVVCVAFFAKVIGGTLAAKLNGLVWRESFTIGALMSCKGLVELIVLNIGLQAKILSTRTFTIFVVMALITTFATTPLTTALYPHWYQIKIEAWKRGEIDWEGNRLTDDDNSTDPDETSMVKAESTEIGKILTYLRLDSMPGVLALVSLFSKPISTTAVSRVHHTKPEYQGSEESDAPNFLPGRPVQIYGLHLMELTDRASSVMRVAEIDEFTLRDPVVNTFRMFGQLRDLPVSGQVMVVPEASFATTLVDEASDVSADMMLIPWTLSGTMSEYEIEDSTNRFANGAFSHFVLSSLTRAPCNTAVFVDNGFSNKKKAKASKALSRTISSISTRDMHHFSTATVNRGYHLYLPYIGSDDDKAAIRLVLQLARDPSVTATIVQFELPEATVVDLQDAQDREQLSSAPTSTSTKSKVHTAAYKVSSDRYSGFFSAVRDSLPTALASRVIFETILSNSPYQTIIKKIKDDIEHSPKDSGDLIVLGRNSAMDTILSASSGDGASSALLESDAKQGLGVLAEGILGRIPKASLLVVKSSR